jgi:hypothetical protein
MEIIAAIYLRLLISIQSGKLKRTSTPLDWHIKRTINVGPGFLIMFGGAISMWSRLFFCRTIVGR